MVDAFLDMDNSSNSAISHYTPPIYILRLPDVIKRVGLKRSALYQRASEGTFPKQISLGGRAVGWLESEIDAWLIARVQLTRNGGAE